MKEQGYGTRLYWTNLYEYIKSNGGFYFYLYPFGDLVQIISMEVSMCSLINETF
jgi:hypothetical protein